MYYNLPRDFEAFKDKNLSVECPYCKEGVRAIPACEPIKDINDYFYFVALCPNHKARGYLCKPFFAVWQALNDRITARYPMPHFESDHYHVAIPGNVREDFAEAHRCQSVQAYKGVVSMSRRVVEAIACDKLGSLAKRDDGETKKLWVLIDLLKEKGFITEGLRATAHEIRHFGNYGCHVQDDELDKVTWQEAGEILKLAGLLLTTIYVNDAETARLKAAREEKARTSATVSKAK